MFTIYFVLNQIFMLLQMLWPDAKKVIKTTNNYNNFWVAPFEIFHKMSILDFE